MISTMRRHPAGTHLGLMLALTFSTGVIDAVGYLGLDRVFTGNMTGNIVILGMALTGADDLPIIGPVLALAGFMVGAAVAGRLLRDLVAGWSRSTTVVFSLVALVLVAAGVTMIVLEDPAEPVLLGVTTALGLAMGAQAGAARHIAVKDVTTVVVTSTITGLAADSVFGSRVDKHPWRRRAGAIALIGAGAAVGALVLNVHIAFGIALSAAITIVVAVLGHLGRPREE
ncbi:YoaK family protein [Agromyces sp. ISL-38]|uniref:YoaK family protein n=1 Tax=Agromyces sp. ISL-38 TaxID=2819107 RepID=UPI0027E08AEC|nr:YoaK family protein [Agromyces sp. ISL-38]